MTAVFSEHMVRRGDGRRSSYTMESTSPLARSYSQNFALHPRSRLNTAISATSRPKLVGTSCSKLRPNAHQTQEEQNSLFSMTKAQNRHQWLCVRVRVTDGRVEQEAWRELLSTESTSRGRNSVVSVMSADNNEWQRRNSSRKMSLSTISPLTVTFSSNKSKDVGGSGSRRASEGGIVSPLSNFFSSVDLQQSQLEKLQTRSLKRTNSTIAKSSFVQDSALSYSVDLEHQHTAANGVGWVATLPFKRRQSEQFECFAGYNIQTETNCNFKPQARHLQPLVITSDASEPSEVLPARRLARTRAPDLLHLAPQGRRHSLHAVTPCTSTFSPDSAASTASTEVTPSTSATLLTLPPSTEGRRGTFGSEVMASESQKSPVHPTGASTSLVPASTLSAASTVEFLDSPASTDSKSVHGLRHTASLKEFRRSRFDSPPSCESDRPTLARPKSEMNTSSASTVPSLRRYDSSCSLFSVNSDSPSPFSHSEQRLCGYATALAPRTGARKFDASRHALISTAFSPSLVVAPPCHAPPLSDPYLKSDNGIDTKPQALSLKIRGVGGLGTGSQVYAGIDIPCASIHLHSDPEDNQPPAMAMTSVLGKIGAKKLKYKKTNIGPDNLRACTPPAEQPQPKHNGLSRWFTSLGKL